MWILQCSTMSYCVILTHISNFYQHSHRCKWNVTAVFFCSTFLSRVHFSASFIPPPLLVGLFICDYTSFVLAHFSPLPSSHSSIPLSFCPSVYVALSMLARASLFPCWSLASSPTLLFSLLFTHPPPTFLLHRLLLLVSFFPFCMCARVRGARHSVQPSGLKVNTYVIANCLQSLGAALKKDMLRRQLRPLAFASLSDRICFKGLVHIIFNPRAVCAPWKKKEYAIYSEFHNTKFVWKQAIDDKLIEVGCVYILYYAVRICDLTS